MDNGPCGDSKYQECFFSFLDGRLNLNLETAVKSWFNNLKVLEMGPLRFRKGELKVTFTRPLKLKGDLYER